MTRTLQVDLGDRSYPIFIGQNILAKKEWFDEKIVGKQLLIVTNTTVAPLYLDRLLETLQGYQLDTLVLEDGEQYKNLDTLNTIFDQLISDKHNRTTTLIALGGGVVGDITGFAAACYQRGVNFIQVPTTLLAQVDSSVGGKTAVNHPLGKNMIGAFHQPVAVIADTETLKTLPDREYRAGLAEVIKYGLIRDLEFFIWLEENLQALLARNDEALAYAIERSCKNKAEIVAQDEREGGIRATLNLGHTFGHAIETAQSYRDWLHGEAVAAGTVMAADLSARLGWISSAEVNRVIAILSACELPCTAPSGISPQQFLELMAVDKKVLDGSIRLVLLSALGQAVVTSEFDSKYLQKTLQSYTS